LDKHIIDHGIFQDWIVTRLSELVSPDAVIFDIGANVGLLTVPFAKLAVPKGVVYAFEPDPQNVNQLLTNVQLNKLNNVVVVPGALQDDPIITVTTLYVRRAIDGDGKTNRGLSTLQNLPVHNVGQTDVLALTIDRYVRDQGIPIVHFIKIDTEGNELKVLQGGKQTIEDHLPIILYEFSLTVDGLSDSQNSSHCYRFLKELGYRQYQIVQEKYLLELVELKPDLVDSNVICFHGSKITPRLSDWLIAHLHQDPER
jgi:FkbM family methyltransferase